MKSIVRLFTVLPVILSAAFLANSQTLKGDYQFQGNLNSAVPGAPAMTNLTGSDGANSYIRGISRRHHSCKSERSRHLQVSPANILSFFQDESVFEASPGNVARIRLYDAAMTEAQIFALDRVANANGGGSQPIVFSSLRDGPYELYTMNEDGTNQRRLSNDAAYQENPWWSPNGTKIIYESTQANTAGRLIFLS